MKPLDLAQSGRVVRSDPTDWRPAVQARLLAALGSVRLSAVLLEIACEMAGANEVFGFRVVGDTVAESLISQGRRGSARSRASLYLRHFRHLDPLRDVMSQHVVDDVVILASFRRDDIDSPLYRQQCFDHPGLVEKVCCFQRTGEIVHVLTFYRSEGEFVGRYDDLLGLAQLALPVIRRHGELLGEDADQTLAERLQKRLVARFPLLTMREREVCARTMAGMTAEAIALDLGIGRTSVLTYRRRAYERYGISAAGQLIGDVLS